MASITAHLYQDTKRKSAGSGAGAEGHRLLQQALPGTNNSLMYVSPLQDRFGLGLSPELPDKWRVCWEHCLDSFLVLTT